jgi:hypothetical protein
MRLNLERRKLLTKSIIGKLTVAGTNFSCYTLEPNHRNPYWEGHPCIPFGCYGNVRLRDSNNENIRDSHGQVLEIYNVSGRSDILLHIGNYPKNTKGCILVGTFGGENVEFVGSSKDTFQKLTDLIRNSGDSQNSINITEDLK